MTDAVKTDAIRVCRGRDVSDSTMLSTSVATRFCSRVSLGALIVAGAVSLQGALLDGAPIASARAQETAVDVSDPSVVVDLSVLSDNGHIPGAGVAPSPSDAALPHLMPGAKMPVSRLLVKPEKPVRILPPRPLTPPRPHSQTKIARSAAPDTVTTPPPKAGEKPQPIVLSEAPKAPAATQSSAPVSASAVAPHAVAEAAGKSGPGTSPSRGPSTPPEAPVIASAPEPAPTPSVETAPASSTTTQPPTTQPPTTQVARAMPSSAEPSAKPSGEPVHSPKITPPSPPSAPSVSTPHVAIPSPPAPEAPATGPAAKTPAAGGTPPAEGTPSAIPAPPEAAPELTPRKTPLEGAQSTPEGTPREASATQTPSAGHVPQGVLNVPPPPAEPSSSVVLDIPPPAKKAAEPASPSEKPGPQSTLQARLIPNPPASDSAVSNSPLSNSPAPTTPSTPDAIVKGDTVQILFPPEQSKIPDDALRALETLAQKMKKDGTLRLQLLAYASGSDLSASKARRLSLSRALSVRSHLIQSGVHSTRIDVRALGDKASKGDPNRVDITVVER